MHKGSKAFSRTSLIFLLFGGAYTYALCFSWCKITRNTAVRQMKTKEITKYLHLLRILLFNSPVLDRL